MTLGDGNASDNTMYPPANDAGAQWQQQSALAAGRLSSEGNANFLTRPTDYLGGLGSELPDFSLVNGGSGGAGFSATSDNPATKLDKSKTVDQLIVAGVFQALDVPLGQKQASDATTQALKPGESPQVTVTYADGNSGAQQKTPDFIVRQDGTIMAASDPKTSNQKDVVIQVERAPGSVANPDANQQKSIDGLVNYLYGRYASDNPAVAHNGLKLDDQYGLISGDVSQKVAAKPGAADSAVGATAGGAGQNFAPQTQGAIAQANRFTPGSSGSLSRQDVDSYVPERVEPRVKDETQSIADIKNAIAADFRPDAATAADKNAPYETSRMDRVGASEVPAVGRYGMTYPIIRGWFACMFGGDGDFDDDSIVGRMDALAKDGKVSKAFAAKFHNKAFAHRFVHAVHQMKAGNMPSHEEMKDLMPPQLQEQITADMVGKFAQAAGGDVGKTALAFHLGKSPDQLSGTELGDKGNKQYGQAAAKFGQLSHARDSMAAGDKLNYLVGQDGTSLDAKIKHEAKAQAASMGGSHGINRCAEGVQLAMAKAGDKRLLGSGNGRQMDGALKSDPNLVCVDRATALDAVRKGHVAIVTREWTQSRIAAHGGKNYGHIEILMDAPGGKIMGASDYYGEHHVENSAYNWRADHFYLPKVDIAGT